VKKEHIIEILILIFIVFCLGFASFWSYKIFFVEKNAHTLYFTDVDGIVKGSPVKFLGVTIGHVEKINYIKENGMISVKFVITKKDIEIPEGSSATVQFAGIAGSRSIEIEPPKNNKSPYGIIITKNPIRIKDLFEFGCSYAQAVIGVENELKILPINTIYKVLDKTSKNYNWDNIDKSFDNASNRIKDSEVKFKKIIDKEDSINKKIEKINAIINKEE